MHSCLALDPIGIGMPCSFPCHVGHRPRPSSTFGLGFLLLTPKSISDITSYSLLAGTLRYPLTTTTIKHQIRRRQVTSAPATMLPQNPVVADICATFIAGGVALFFLLLWEETAKRGVFDQVKIPSFSSLLGTQYSAYLYVFVYVFCLDIQFFV